MDNRKIYNTYFVTEQSGDSYLRVSRGVMDRDGIDGHVYDKEGRTYVVVGEAMTEAEAHRVADTLSTMTGMPKGAPRYR